MAKRVPKHIAHELIQFVKKVDVKANYFDPTAKSAVEFARQMSSPKLQKINSNFACNFIKITTNDPPEIKAEFLDGSTWVQVSSEMNAAEIRSEFYSKAEDAEERIEASGSGKKDDAKAPQGKGGAGASKAAPAAAPKKK